MEKIKEPERLYIGYPTALEIWDAVQQHGGQQTAMLAIPDLTGSIATQTALDASMLGTANWSSSSSILKPITVLVANNKLRAHCQAIESQVWPYTLPPRAFRLLDSTCALATPAYCFVLAASRLEFIDLLQLGLEICGTYSTGSDSLHEISDIAPKTSVAAIKSMLAEIPPSRTTAYTNAQRACAYLIDRIASPMEGVVYLLICLPYRLGGYGLPQPIANMPIAIPSYLQRYTRTHEVYPDLCWPEAKVCLEYDSDEHHKGGAKAASDSARRDVLTAMGYKVHTLNKTQADNYQLFDATVHHIAAELGKRLRDTPDRANYPKMMEQRRLLRGVLLNRSRDWKHAFVRHTR